MVKVVAKPDEESRTGAGPNAVESLDDLAREGTQLQAGEAEQRQAVAVAHEQSAERQQQVEQQAAANEIAALLGLVRDMAAPLVEDAGYLKAGQTKAIWTDVHLQRTSVPLIVVMERHGMELGDLMEKAGPYVMLVAGLALPGVATIKAVRENKAARQAEKTEPAPDGQQQPA
jgi:hypothetical protein